MDDGYVISTYVAPTGFRVIRPSQHDQFDHHQTDAAASLIEIAILEDNLVGVRMLLRNRLQRHHYNKCT